jgi:uncharacterized membrane protein
VERGILIRNFTKAPDGQPTSNIQFMRSNAVNRLAEDILHVKELERRLTSARESERYWRNEVAVFDFQLQERAREVNGL